MSMRTDNSLKKCVRSANLFHLQPFAGRRIWCIASTFSCMWWNWFY